MPAAVGTKVEKRHARARRRSRGLGPALALAIAAICALPGPAGAVTRTFDFTGAAQSFTVPAGVTELGVEVSGAAGGNSAAGNFLGGLGGRVAATVPAAAGEVWQVNVGGAGANGVPGGDAAGGFNGGGGVSGCGGADNGGAGGGGSDLRRDADAGGGYGLDERVVVAGGGGGADNGTSSGGAGGGTTGGDGGNGGMSTPAGGGTQSAGGAAGTPDGAAGQLGAGADSAVCTGAGGGGLYGGGSGPFGAGITGGGGGGSGFAVAGATNVSNQQGLRAGDGEVVITYTVTPTMTTSASADVTLGGQVSDSATIANGADPTGQVTFRLYGPDDPACSGAPAFTDTKAVAGNGAYTSQGFTPSAAGTYRWIASYSGDADNHPVAGACGDPDETVTVAPAPPVPPPEPAIEVIGLERDRRAGTATLTVAANAGGNLTVDKTNKVRGFGPAKLGGAGAATLEVVPRNKAARKLARRGRLTVNPRIRLIPSGAQPVLIRHEFKLRRD